MTKFIKFKKILQNDINAIILGQNYWPLKKNNQLSNEMQQIQLSLIRHILHFSKKV